MERQIRNFLDALDRELAGADENGPLDLYHLGRSALILAYRLPLTTRDFDIVAFHTALERIALEKFGKDTPLAQQLGLFLEAVPQGLPPLPNGFRTRCREVSGGWRAIRLWQLDPHDLAATKLKCFRPQDRQDVRFLCDQGLLEPSSLRGGRWRKRFSERRARTATQTMTGPSPTWNGWSPTWKGECGPSERTRG